MLTVSQAASLLRSFDNVLILTHVRPDGDTVGCAAALCAGLRALGKTAYLLPNPELTDTTVPYFAPYAAPGDFVPESVVSTDVATVCLFPEMRGPMWTGWTWPSTTIPLLNSSAGRHRAFGGLRLRRADLRYSGLSGPCDG